MLTWLTSDQPFNQPRVTDKGSCVGQISSSLIQVHICSHTVRYPLLYSQIYFSLKLSDVLSHFVRYALSYCQIFSLILSDILSHSVRYPLSYCHIYPLFILSDMLRYLSSNQITFLMDFVWLLSFTQIHSSLISHRLCNVYVYFQCSI